MKSLERNRSGGAIIAHYDKRALVVE